MNDVTVERFVEEAGALSPEGRRKTLELMLLFLHDPGFAEAYEALPHAPGHDYPSITDVEALMAERGKRVYL